MTRTLLLSATILAASLAAQGAGAQPISGLYIGAGGGANFMERQRVESVTSGGKTAYSNARVSFDDGVVGLGSVGWGFGNGLRLELEGNYRQNRMSPLPGPVSSGGTERKYGGMFNVLFDLDVGSPYIFPYIGGGMGFVHVEQKNTSTFADGSRVSIDGSDNAFAYQAIAGLSFPVPRVVGLSLTAEYRYYSMAGEREYPFVTSGAAPFGGVTGRYKTSGNYNHSLLLGVRYAFNVAPPAVEAPAVPTARAEAARTYLVFFDWDRADLTDRARQIIAEAASASQRVAVTRIEVSGHTDTTGSAAYNQTLSVRRAETVAVELVRLGVPRAAITTQGFGFSRPLVATGPNVREPQNRRVEIILK